MHRRRRCAPVADHRAKAIGRGGDQSTAGVRERRGIAVSTGTVHPCPGRRPDRQYQCARCGAARGGDNHGCGRASVAIGGQSPLDRSSSGDRSLGRWAYPTALAQGAAGAQAWLRPVARDFAADPCCIAANGGAMRPPDDRRPSAPSRSVRNARPIEHYTSVGARLSPHQSDARASRTADGLRPGIRNTFLQTSEISEA